MTNQRSRGQQGRDPILFGPLKTQEKLKEATADMCFLLSRGYAEKSSLQLVGNRYRLNVRQQQAVQGMAASEAQIQLRAEHRISFDALTDETLIIDGFNLLILLESALSEAYLFKGLDGAYRDLSGVHGTYKRIQHTEAALLLIGNCLKAHHVIWVFDQPVSNSGRLKTQLRELAEAQQFHWTIELDHNPDKVLAASAHIVISSDAWILDRAKTWLNLGAYLIENHIQNPHIVHAD